MLDKPLFFERNRVGRVYTGGKLFHGFFGDAPEDGYEPEEWIASCVRATNKVPKSPREGVSRLQEDGVYFDELLEQHGEALLGKGKTLRILVKALDSAIRLPAQAHPDKAFSRQNFGSDYGKTECWLILDTRPDASLFFGFRDGVTEAEFCRAIEESETDAKAMEGLMCKITPQKGEVYFVPAKTVHAIGAGCLILEVQEPTDFVIQPERYCGEYRLSDQEMYFGLDKDTAIRCFDFNIAPAPRLAPREIARIDGVVIEELVGEKDTDCFVINRIRVSGGEHLLNVVGSYAVYIITDGEACLQGDGYERRLKKGDYFFMPACLMGRFTIRGSAEIVECY